MKTKRNWKMKGFRGRRQIPFAPNNHSSDYIGQVLIEQGWSGPNVWSDAPRTALGYREMTVTAARPAEPHEVPEGFALRLEMKRHITLRAWTWRGLEREARKAFAR